MTVVLLKNSCLARVVTEILQIYSTLYCGLPNPSIQLILLWLCKDMISRVKAMELEYAIHVSTLHDGRSFTKVSLKGGKRLCVKFGEMTKFESSPSPEI